MAWVYLFIAGLFEIGWAVGIKYSDGFSRFWPATWTILAMIASVVLLALAVKTLPLGTSYAIWTGIGVIGTVIYGIVFLHDPCTPIRLICIGLIMLGILGLKVTSAA
jgi:quaternary ammonium compound-resistance protein SugE